MKKYITITINGDISDKALEEYYNRLWTIIEELYGEETLKKIYIEMNREIDGI